MERSTMRNLSLTSRLLGGMSCNFTVHEANEEENGSDGNAKLRSYEGQEWQSHQRVWFFKELTYEFRKQPDDERTVQQKQLSPERAA
jgi:hypothetical protein